MPIKKQYIHEITLPETGGDEKSDRFAENFNHISDVWRKSQDPKFSKKERKEFSELWLQKRICLEMGMM